MYQTQIEMAELRQQEIVAWAAREQLAIAAIRGRKRQEAGGQKSLFARLAMSLDKLFTKPQPQVLPVRTTKQRA